MKHPGTIVEFDGHEYLLLESGYNDEVRAVTVLSRPGHPDLPQKESTRPVSWLDQGDWYPLARWTPEELVIPEEKHAEHRAHILEIVKRYDAARPEPKPVAWVVAHEDGLLGTLIDTIPMGVAAIVYEEREAAELSARAGRSKPEEPDKPELYVGEWTDLPDGGEAATTRVVPIHSIGRFFTHLVREGYAGCVWNHVIPVFFCADVDGDLQFLRIGGEAGSVTMEILDNRDVWLEYDGEESIEVLDNREAYDQRLVSELGPVPVLEWKPGDKLYVAGERSGSLSVVDDESGVRYAVIFTKEKLAKLWCDETEREGWAVFEVTPAAAAALLDNPDVGECVFQLNPGFHRAVTGMLWRDGDSLVLDSFSGFWRMAEDGDFEAVVTGDDDEIV